MAYEDEHFVDSTRMVWNYSLFEEEDIVRFQAGTMQDAYDKFRNHRKTV